MKSHYMHFNSLYNYLFPIINYDNTTMYLSNYEFVTVYYTIFSSIYIFKYYSSKITLIKKKIIITITISLLYFKIMILLCFFKA